MTRIHIDTRCPYDVLLGRELLPRCGEFVAPFCCSGRAVLLYDTCCVREAQKVATSLQQAGIAVLRRGLTGGEAHKTMADLTDLLTWLTEQEIRRNDLLLALGGGTIGDLVGFAAAVYRRGVDYIQVPTTLLAMVDAAIGGKTGVDLSGGKNMVGAFHQPRLVLCDLTVAESLPQEIFCQGLAEMLKCDLIRPDGIRQAMEEDRLSLILPEAVEHCIRLKGELVARDEEDRTGLRRQLNVGHTVAHALELCSGYTITHAAAVATGLVWEAALAQQLGLCGECFVRTLQRIAIHYDLYVTVPCSVEQMLRAMGRDKKNEDEQITFLLPMEMGCLEQKMTADQLRTHLENIQVNIHKWR